MTHQELGGSCCQPANGSQANQNGVTALDINRTSGLLPYRTEKFLARPARRRWPAGHLALYLFRRPARAGSRRGRERAAGLLADRRGARQGEVPRLQPPGARQANCREPGRHSRPQSAANDGRPLPPNGGRLSPPGRMRCGPANLAGNTKALVSLARPAPVSGDPGTSSRAANCRSHLYGMLVSFVTLPIAPDTRRAGAPQGGIGYSAESARLPPG